MQNCLMTLRTKGKVFSPCLCITVHGRSYDLSRQSKLFIAVSARIVYGVKPYFS